MVWRLQRMELPGGFWPRVWPVRDRFTKEKPIGLDTRGLCVCVCVCVCAQMKIDPQASDMHVSNKEMIGHCLSVWSSPSTLL